MSEPATTDAPAVDVRIGSTANALQPVSSAERSLAAGRSQWVILASRRGRCGPRRPAHEAGRGRTLALGESVDIVGPFSIHHVQNSGIAFGLFGSSTSLVIAVTAVAVARCSSSSRAPDAAIPSFPSRSDSYSGEHRQPDRPRPARARDGLPRPRRLAGFQPGGHLHRRRRRDPLRRARPRRSLAPDARGTRWRRFASRSLTTTRARVSTACSPRDRRSRMRSLAERLVAPAR